LQKQQEGVARSCREGGTYIYVWHPHMTITINIRLGLLLTAFAALSRDKRALNPSLACHCRLGQDSGNPGSEHPFPGIPSTDSTIHPSADNVYWPASWLILIPHTA